MVLLKKKDIVVDVCPTCAGIWFDPGEMVLLTEDIFKKEEKAGEGVEARDGPPLLRSRKDLTCSGCGSTLHPVDYQYTGNPVFHCNGCNGTFVPLKSARKIHRSLKEGREKAANLLGKGETIGKDDAKGRGFSGMARAFDDEQFFLPIPAVIPIESEIKLGILPYVTFSVMVLFLLFFLMGKKFFGGSKEVAQIAALTTGSGFSNPIKLMGYGLFHTDILPLIVNCAFVYMAGAPLEERLSPAKFILLLFAGIAACGAVHLFSSSPGGQILGAAGGVSAILGGYVVIFPLIKVRVFAMGYLLSLPSYLMVIAWLVIFFFMTGDFISAYLDPYGPGFVPVAAAFLTGLGITAGLKMATGD